MGRVYGHSMGTDRSTQGLRLLVGLLLTIPHQGADPLALQTLLHHAILLGGPDVFELLPEVEADLRRMAVNFASEFLDQTPVPGNFIPVEHTRHGKGVMLFLERYIYILLKF